MRSLLLFSAALLLAACSSEKAAAPAETKAMTEKASTMVAEDSRLVAVLSYADWCSSCKILDPKLKAVKARGDIDGVSYVTLDYTDRDPAAMFAAADAAGVGEAIRTHLADEIFTGWLMLVDRDDQKVIGVVKKGMSEDEIEAAIKAAAASA